MADLSTNVKKRFRHKVSGTEFTVTEHVPDFDFGGRRGGRKPAFHIVRADTDTVSTVKADAFLIEHEPVAETAKTP